MSMESDMKSNLLSKNTVNTGIKEKSNRHIVCLSGGVASAVVAKWVKENVEGEVVYYFNDVKWEHPDLYRFNSDLEKALGIKIFPDTDGRTPEQVFYDSKMLGSNRTPLCSKILKAERLQKFVKSGDTLYFGIDEKEIHRAARITPIYERFGCKCVFPMIDHNISKEEAFQTIKDLGIELPQMYKDGFEHNNCSGGCVRAGQKQWRLLLRLYPDVYAERERVEREYNEWYQSRALKKTGSYKMLKEYSYMKDMTLKEFRELIQKQPEMSFMDDSWQGECIGICGDMN